MFNPIKYTKGTNYQLKNLWSKKEGFSSHIEKRASIWNVKFRFFSGVVKRKVEVAESIRFNYYSHAERKENKSVFSEITTKSRKEIIGY